MSDSIWLCDEYRGCIHLSQQAIVWVAACCDVWIQDNQPIALSFRATSQEFKLCLNRKFNIWITACAYHNLLRCQCWISSCSCRAEGKLFHFPSAVQLLVSPACKDVKHIISGSHVGTKLGFPNKLAHLLDDMIFSNSSGNEMHIKQIAVWTDIRTQPSSNWLLGGEERIVRIPWYSIFQSGGDLGNVKLEIRICP